MNRILQLLFLVFLILLIPLIAMQFTNEVQWSTADFAVAGIILFVLGVLIDMVFTKFRDSSYKWIIAILVFLLFVLIWADLAVGLFDTPWSGS